VRRLVDRSRQLAIRPLTGRVVPEYQRSDLREILERPYRIIYTILEREQRIDIVTVLHYRQLPPEDPAQLQK